MADGLSFGGGGLGLSFGGGEGLSAPSDFGGGIGTSLAGVDTGVGYGGDYGFSAPGGLGLSLEDSFLGLTPEGSYGMQGEFSDLGYGPLADYSVSPASTSTAEMGSTGGFDNVLSFFNRASKNPAVMMALAKAVPQLAPMLGVLNLARGAQTPQGAASAFGGKAGAILGGLAGGVPGALAGGWAGGKLGAMSGGLPGYTGPTTQPGLAGGGTEMDLGGIAGSLGQLYQAGRAGREAGQVASTLGDLYGQNSPYAQALRQQLERKDAAAGRRSQYGPREVELQARLAGLYSQNAPQTMAAQAAARAARNRKFAAGLGLAKETGLLDYGQRALRNLWNTPTDMTGFQTPVETSNYADWVGMAPTAQAGTDLGAGTFGAQDWFLNY